MTLRYEQETEDVVAASALMATRLRLFFLALWLLIVAVSAVGVKDLLASGSTLQDAVLHQAVAPVLLALLLVFLAWVHPRLAARGTVLRPVQWQLSAEGVHLESNVASTRMNWQAFYKFRENKKVFLLYVQRGQANFIPKRILTPAQVVELRALLTAYVPRL